MNLGLFAKGLDLMPDFGYPPVQFGGWGSRRAHWYRSTPAHNTVVVDDRDTMRPGWKYAEWEQKGVPLRIEIGPRDVAAGQVMFAARHDRKKQPVPLDEAVTALRRELERIQADLNYLKVGKGKYFTFFRPYHLWFLEAPISIARAYLQRQTTLVPLSLCG